MIFKTNFRYYSREDKPEYVWNKYKSILKGKILDVGADKCGLRVFLPKDTNYLGIGRGANVDVELDLEKEMLPYEDNSFDCVLCLDVLEHLDNIHEVFDDLCRVTKKYLIISLPNPWQGFISMIVKGYYDSNKPMKFYNLPVSKPKDRHKWFYGLHEAENFVLQRGMLNKMNLLHVERIKYSPKLHFLIMKTILKFLIDRDVNIYSLLDKGIWIVLGKNS